jgi:RES domain
MTFSKTFDYLKFSREVKLDRHFVWSGNVQEFLDAVLGTSEDRSFALPSGETFWRAQLGNDWRKLDDDIVEYPYSPERMKPLREAATEGRANPKGIPVIYVATQKITAISETRPWIGSYFSVARLKTTKPLKLVNCGRTKKPLLFVGPEDDHQAQVDSNWSWIDHAFSEPTTRHDDRAEYAATQILCELFKHNSYDGVAYRSRFGEEGFNIALFDLDSVKITSCEVVKVDHVDLKISDQQERYLV